MAEREIQNAHRPARKAIRCGTEEAVGGVEEVAVEGVTIIVRRPRRIPASDYQGAQQPSVEAVAREMYSMPTRTFGDVVGEIRRRQALYTETVGSLRANRHDETLFQDRTDDS
jgi:hypothetical protein